MSGVAPDTSATSETAKGSSNLYMRVVAALVLAPLTIAIAWIGGWPWAFIVIAAAALLYFEWLMIVGASGNRFAVATGVAALAIAGVCLMMRRTDLALGSWLRGSRLPLLPPADSGVGPPADWCMPLPP